MKKLMNNIGFCVIIFIAAYITGNILFWATFISFQVGADLQTHLQFLNIESMKKFLLSIVVIGVVIGGAFFLHRIWPRKKKNIWNDDIWDEREIY